MKKIFIYQLFIVFFAWVSFANFAQANAVIDTSKIGNDNETGEDSEGLELKGTLYGDYINGAKNNLSVIGGPSGLLNALKKREAEAAAEAALDKGAAKSSIVNTNISGVPQVNSDFGQSPSNPNGGPSINDVLTELDNAADNKAFAGIFRNAIAGLLSGGGGGGFDFGPILSSLFGSIVGENGSIFNSQAENSFKAASASNSVFASLANNNAGINTNLSYKAPNLSAILTGDRNTAHLGGVDGGRDYNCLVKVICSEARGERYGREGLDGKIAVGFVVLNRVKKRKLSVCGVIYQKSQFENIHSYNIMGSGTDKDARRDCKKAADYVMSGAPDITNGADHFAAIEVLKDRVRKGIIKRLPPWTQTMRAVARVGGHTFYRSA